MKQMSLGARVGLSAVLGCACSAMLGTELIGAGVRSAALFGVAFIFALLAWYFPRQRSLLLVACTTGFCALAFARTHEIQSTSIERVLSLESRLITIEGVVVEPSRQRNPDRGTLGEWAPPWTVADRMSAMVSVDALHTSSDKRLHHTGLLRVSAPMDMQALHVGDRVRVLGWARASSPPTNDGQADWRMWNRSRGIAGTLRAESITLLSSSSRVDRSLHTVRSMAQDAIDRDAGGEADLLSAILLGIREGADYREVSMRFADAGVGHLLAISGLHVGIVLVGVSFLVRLTGDRPRAELIALVLVGIVLVVLIPARPPILRALIIAFAFLLARACGTRADAMTLLGWAACLTLMIWPSDVVNAGFQLTFAVVVSLVLWSERLRARIFPGTLVYAPGDSTIGSAIIHWAQSALAAGIVAWVISTPLIAWHFGALPLLAIPMTIALTPLVAAALFVGYLGIALSIVWSAGGSALIAVASHVTASMDWLTRLVDLGTIAAPRIALAGPAGIACCASLLGIGAWVLHAQQRVSLERRVLIRARSLCAIGVLVWVVGYMTFGQTLPSTQAARLTMFDVGDGQCVLLRSGDEAMLVDAGSSWLGAGVRMLPDAIRAQGVTRINVAALSHADIDHFGVLLDIHQRIPITRVLIGAAFEKQAADRPSGAEAALLTQLMEAGIEVQIASRGMRFSLGDVTLRVLHPEAEQDFPKDNDDSLVFLASTMSNGTARTFLLPGDIERDGIQAVTRVLHDARVDVLVVPHHGSARPFAADFVKRIASPVVLQSTSDQRVGLPIWQEAYAASDWYDTPTHGQIDVLVLTDGELRVRTRTMRQPW